MFYQMSVAQSVGRLGGSPVRPVTSRLSVLSGQNASFRLTPLLRGVVRDLSATATLVNRPRDHANDTPTRIATNSDPRERGNDEAQRFGTLIVEGGFEPCKVKHLEIKEYETAESGEYERHHETPFDALLQGDVERRKGNARQ